MLHLIAIKMDEKKLKHLEFIQQIITRMNTNSFLLKGWTVTLVAAIFALAAKDANQKYFIVSYLPIPIFWYLDAFFLSQERKFRKLYDVVRLKAVIDFSMDTSLCNEPTNSVAKTFFSKTIFIFYSILVIITTLIIINIFLCS